MTKTVPIELLPWRDGYRVDPVRGLVIGVKGRPVGRPLPTGYIHLAAHGRYVGYAHRIVWEAVNGPIPADREINHINGIKDDNRIENLELVTSAENKAHAVRTGLAKPARGERVGRATLTADAVLSMRAKHAAGESYGRIAKDFGVHRNTVWKIVGRKRWTHI